MKSRRRAALLATTAAALLIAVSVRAQEPTPGRLPAVSGLNGRLQVDGGIADGDGRWSAGGAVTAPLGFNFGVQLDGYGAEYDGDFIGGAAAHLFWRDPAVGLAGIYGSYTYFDAHDGLDLGRLGPEAELYLDRLTLYATVGAQLGDGDKDIYSIADIGYYPTDDIRLAIGHRYADVGHVGSAEAEVQVYSGNGIGVAFYAEGRFNGEEDAAWAGVRLYFGSDKTLIRRHREDDPPINLDDDAYSLATGVQPPPSPTVSNLPE